MQVKNIKKVGKRKVYDISVKDVEHYALENGVITHNTGVIYSADNVWIIGRNQEKEKSGEVSGYKFIINVEKSRYVKEKSKIPITVNFNGGINKYSGMIDIAVDENWAAKVSGPRGAKAYQRVNPETGEFENDRIVLEKDVAKDEEFWKDLIDNADFQACINKKYTLFSGTLIDIDSEDE